MLNQNIKGFLTLILVIGIVVSLFYGYKGIIEPRFIENEVDQLPLEPAEQTDITPKIEIYSDRAVVEWTTPYNSEASLLYTQNKEDCTNNEESENCSIIQNEEEEGEEHLITIENLEPGTEYFYKIGIDGVFYPQEEENYFSFKTPLLDVEENTQNQQEQETPEEQTQETSSNISLEEFTTAMEEQNLDYDFNGDGRVTTLDFSLYKSSNSE